MIPRTVKFSGLEGDLLNIQALHTGAVSEMHITVGLPDSRICSGVFLGRALSASFV